MSDYRIEHDSMGQIKVPVDKYWGAVTQRSFENFKIGTEKMPIEIIYALTLIKKASAKANLNLNPKKMTEQKCMAITTACDEILSGALDAHFPLAVWQTGSGTQTNMNVNEVIANRANQIIGQNLLHPNDDVNMSQSSNDVFPSAIHLSALLCTKNKLIPAINELILSLKTLEEKYQGVLKIGRTHLQDATPVSFSQEISGWRASLEGSLSMINSASQYLCALALGGTATGTGVCSPINFGKEVCKILSEYVECELCESQNKFSSLSSKNAVAFFHGALNTYASDLWKIANDIRFLASGPRCGIGEITIPSNEPGSSIMPGKVNPTQCEAVTMVALQVAGNNTSVATASSQGNFQLNVFMPLIAYNTLQSLNLLADVTHSFDKNCVVGIVPNCEKMKNNLQNSLMLVTALSTEIGYENAAKVAKHAFDKKLTLKQACQQLKILDGERFDEIVKPENMITGY